MGYVAQILHVFGTDLATPYCFKFQRVREDTSQLQNNIASLHTPSAPGTIRGLRPTSDSSWGLLLHVYITVLNVAWQ